MFKFLKEKLGSWMEKSKKKIEEKAEKQEEEVKDLEKTKEKTHKKEKQIKKEIKEDKKEIKKEEKELKKAEKTEDKKEIQKAEQDLEKAKEKLEQAKQELQEAEEEKESEEIKETQEKKPGFFQKIKGITSYKLKETEFNEIFEDLELLLLENNVALEVVETLKENLKKELLDKEIKKSEIEAKIKEALKSSLEEIIIQPEDLIEKIKKYRLENQEEPFKIIFFGINGAGKTTTIAKFTDLLKKNNLKVILAAADTFRAASIEQLNIHAEKLDVEMIKHDYGSDPSAVAFDAIKHAKNTKADVVLIDTAGRMHTKENLLREMEKIVRVSQPDRKIFVAEAIAGNDATEQAKAFNEMIEIDGSILSKADVDEKGGTIISIAHTTKKPIFYLGTGQNYDQIELFNKKKFIKQLGFEE
jgi:fused signal recognition particle receptor